MDFNNFFEKYPQQRRVEHELAEIKALSLKLKQDSELFLKLSEMTAPQVCPSREEESFTLVTVVIISTAANLLLSVLVAFCCFRYFKHREKQTINKNTWFFTIHLFAFWPFSTILTMSSPTNTASSSVMKVTLCSTILAMPSGKETAYALQETLIFLWIFLFVTSSP